MGRRTGTFISSYWKAAGRDTPFISAETGMGVSRFLFMALLKEFFFFPLTELWVFLPSDVSIHSII